MEEESLLERSRPQGRYCNTCGSELFGEQEATEEGQEDYPWCQTCVDYCDALGEKPEYGRQS